MSSGSVVPSSAAAVAGFPLVVLLDQDSAGEAEEGGRVREHADDVGAAFDLLVHPFQRVREPDLTPVSLRERREGEKVMLGIAEHRCDLRMRAAQHRGDLGELGVDVLSVGLGEDGADDRGDHVLGPFRHDGEDVAHEMHPASLPCSALEHGADGFLQAFSGRRT